MTPSMAVSQIQSIVNGSKMLKHPCDFLKNLVVSFRKRQTAELSINLQFQRDL